eukprot:5861276-Amphidinium_carterae.1
MGQCGAWIQTPANVDRCIAKNGVNTKMIRVELQCTLAPLANATCKVQQDAVGHAWSIYASL